MPRIAVNGMAISATSIVTMNEFHAEPDRNQPPTPFSTENAVQKYSSVGVLSRPTETTKPPTMIML